ncbi:hypothetical protein D3C73_971190 [compost metagenome]
MVLAVRVAQRGEVHRHAGLDLDHVGLGDLGVDGHYIQPRQHHDGRRSLVGVHRAAFLGHHRHHGAIHRRDDAGIGQVGTGGAQFGFAALDLRFVGLQLRTRGLQLGLGGIVFLARGGLGRQHLLLACELQFGLAQGGLLHRALRGHLVQRGLRVEHLVLLGGGVDLGDQVAFLHRIAQLHLQRLDLAGSLRTDADQLVGVDHAGRFHRLLDVAAADRGGRQGRCGRLAQQPPGGNGGDQDKQGDQHQATLAGRGQQAGDHVAASLWGPQWRRWWAL